MSMESYVLEIIEGKRPGRTFLLLLSYIYHLGIYFRNLAYDRGLVKSYSLPIPVISIGNIVAGGTGKTPLTYLLAKQLSYHKKLAILTRGYRSEIEHSSAPVKIQKGDSPARCGDEPYWLAQKLSHVDIWVGKKRLISAHLAVQSGAQILLLEDGMQHRRVHRDFEVIVVNSSDLFGKGYFLPRGLLRDSPKCLSRADLVVINGISKLVEVEIALRRFTNAPFVWMKMESQIDLQNKSVAVFCAIGQPDRFIKTLESCGAHIKAVLFKEDHLPFIEEEINQLALTSGAELLVCTEKDYVKLPQNFKYHLPLVSVTAQLSILEGQEVWDSFVAAILNR
jgi:tetraacyldisaccharide 4'-kinase